MPTTMAKKPKLLTISEYAAHRDVSQSYISILVKQGVLPWTLSSPEARYAGKRLDPAICDPIMDKRKANSASYAHLKTVNENRRRAAAAARVTSGVEALQASGDADDIEELLRPREPEPAGKGKASSNVVPFIAPALAAANKLRETMDAATGSRAMRERFQAKMAEVDYRKAVGQLVERTAVERAMSECASQARLLLERLPDRVAERLASALGINPAPAHTILANEVRLLCQEIAASAAALPDRVKQRSSNSDVEDEE